MDFQGPLPCHTSLFFSRILADHCISLLPLPPYNLEMRPLKCLMLYDTLQFTEQLNYEVLLDVNKSWKEGGRMVFISPILEMRKVRQETE